MNILFLDQHNVPGGAQQCLLDLLPAMEERGWTARAAVPSGGPFGDLLRGRGVQVDAIQSGPYQGGRKSIGDLVRFATDVPRQIVAIGRLLKQSRTDLLYVNGPRLLPAAAMAARNRVPILFHAHHCIGERSAADLEGLALRRSGAIVAACCDAVAQPLRKWAAPDRIHTIPNGTPDFGFHERPFEKKDAVRIGIVGRISAEKGQAGFLRAAALVASHRPDVRFVICGAPLFGDRSYYDEVLRLSANLPVEFIDWQDDARAVMRRLDVLVIASTQEGMPRVLLEAFSAGLPVVAFPVGGIPEVIEHEITGFLAEGATPVELASALRKMLECDPDRLRAVAYNARREWEQRYTLAAYRRQVTNLMEYAAGETLAPRSRKSETPQTAPENIRGA